MKQFENLNSTMETESQAKETGKVEKKNDTILEKINKIVPIISALIMGLLTYFLWEATRDSATATENSVKASEKSMEMEKHRQTLSLCKEYRYWFTYEMNLAKIDSFLYELKSWEGSLQDSRWLKITEESEKLEKLIQNISIRRLFTFFEDARVLHKQELLDEDYFYNFFYNAFRRLERTSEPTVAAYLAKMRDKYRDDEVYEGYEYCRDTILKLYDTLNINQRAAIEFAKNNKGITIEEYQNIITTEKDKNVLLRDLDEMLDLKFFTKDTITNKYKL